MALRIEAFTFDCADTRRMAEFWSAAMGWEIGEVSDDIADIRDPADRKSVLLLLKVPEGKTVKNRAHLDLRPARTRDEEVERLTRLGATVLEGFEGPNGTWKVLQDPEGNEFCVLRGPEDPVPPGGEPVEF